MRRIAFLAIMASVVMISLFSGCNKSDDNDGQTHMQVYLTDGPAVYDAVYIDIRDVQIKYSQEESENGWVSLHNSSGMIVNLLDFRNGYDTLMAAATVSSGRINQIRLVLGPNNSVVVNGTEYPLETPSAQQSGLKLNIHADLISDIDYRLWIDFDAGRSIVQTGSGKFILKPVIRTFTAALSGSIRGVVVPPTSTAFVYAVRNATDTAGGAIPDLAGRYMIRGLDPGTYTLRFKGMNNYRDTVMQNISVTIGSVTDAGTQVLNQ